MAVVIKRSDRFPVGTTVSAFPVTSRHRDAKPSGSALATATVDATGTLTFPTLGPGVYALFAEVGGVPTDLQAGSETFKAPPASLRKRIAAQRALAFV